MLWQNLNGMIKNYQSPFLSVNVIFTLASEIMLFASNCFAGCGS